MVYAPPAYTQDPTSRRHSCIHPSIIPVIIYPALHCALRFSLSMPMAPRPNSAPAKKNRRQPVTNPRKKTPIVKSTRCAGTRSSARLQHIQPHPNPRRTHGPIHELWTHWTVVEDSVRMFLSKLLNSLRISLSWSRSMARTLQLNTISIPEATNFLIRRTQQNRSLNKLGEGSQI